MSVRTHPEAAGRLGARVKALRLERGDSFDALAEESGLGRGYVSELERGLVVPSLIELECIATALGVTAADLVLGSSAREQLFERARLLTEREVEGLLAMASELAKRGGR